jgi:hypothetical protein
LSRATATTPAQKEVLRLVHGFNGLFGPVAIEAATGALSRCPEKEWLPVVNQLDAHKSKGFLR